ncbi:MAG: hypothetical protein A4E32_00288 [Methanomassiliicoccales archaeon PtaU1.Bin124]|nr:MAG: hypothetical protein A4E32_00288 [Methanomassiliicoccales archaeon PtaU1.Bin124]
MTAGGLDVLGLGHIAAILRFADAQEKIGQIANHFILIGIYSGRDWDANQFRLYYVREPR